MVLRSLAFSGGGLAAVAHAPLIFGFALAGQPDVVRGLLLGLVVGLLNSLLLARKLDRAIDGRDPWQNLTTAMPRNMMLRFALVFAIGVAASRARGVNLAAMAGGIMLYFVVSQVYACWAVLAQWRKEDGEPVYG
jgi:phosphotransferase system  glucose/maltose/N-acetylglucosamine-specific IIC component